MPVCLAPTISLIQPTVVFSLGSVGTVVHPFPFTNTSHCSIGSVSCSFTTTNPYVTFDSTSISFPSTVPLGDYSASVSCTQNSLSSTLDFIYAVVFAPSGALNSSSTLIPNVPDCVSTVVNSTTLDFLDSGGVNSTMIVVVPANSVNGDYLQTLNPHSWMATGTFTQEDVNDGYVVFQPTILQNIFSNRIATVPVTVQDPSANEIVLNLLYNVVWSYCPVVAANYVSIQTSSTSTPIVLTSAMLGIGESHGLSVWDMGWTITSLSPQAGRIEYYCPDTSCGGAGWNFLAIPSHINQSWIMMNALRWNPLTAGASSTYYAVLNSTNSYSNGASSLVLSLQVNSNVTVTNPAVPYLSSQYCNPVTLGNSGLEAATLPFGPFLLYSPIRPICFNVTTPAGGVSYSDFTISATTAGTNVLISGAVNIGSDLILPTGFIPMNFTGTNSIIGQMSQALYVSSTPSSYANPITITLPQTSIGTALYVKGITTISILRYNPSNGYLSHIAPSSWVQSGAIAASLLRLTVQLPTDGYYIFGYLNVPNAVVPIVSNVWVDYLPQYGTMTVQVDRGGLQMQFISSSATTFAVMRPADYMWFPDGEYLLDSFYINTTNTAVFCCNMSLAYTYPSSSISLAQRIQDSSTPVGYDYLYSNTTIVSAGLNFVLNMGLVPASGWFNVLEKVPYISASSPSVYLQPDYFLSISLPLLMLLGL